MSTEGTKDAKSLLNEILPTEYTSIVPSCSLGVEDGSFKARFFLETCTPESFSNWMEAFETKSLCTWRVRHTFPKLSKGILYKKDYHCQHGGKSKARASKKTNCATKMRIVMYEKPINLRWSQHDYYTKVTLSWNHNHELKCAEVQQQRDKNLEAKDTFLGNFDQDHLEANEIKMPKTRIKPKHPLTDDLDRKSESELFPSSAHVTRSSSRRKTIHSGNPVKKLARFTTATKQAPCLNNEEYNSSRHGNKNSKQNISPCHSKISDGNFPNFQCGTCLEHFTDINSLSSHIDQTLCHQNIYQCCLCAESFSSSDALCSHQTISHEDHAKPYKCGLCHVGFFDNALLLRHLKEKHQNLPPVYRCNVCQLLFEQINKLELHVAEIHPVLKLYACSLCGYSFSDGSQLLCHMQEKHDTQSSILHPEIMSNTQTGPQIKISIKRKIRERKSVSMKKSEVNVGQNLIAIKSKSASVHQEEEDENIDIIGVETAKDIGRDTDIFIDVESQEENNLSSGLGSSTKREKNKITKRMKTELMTDMADSENGKSFYDCAICGNRFEDKQIFIQHRSDHFIDGNFSIFCSHCSQTFLDFESLFGHVEQGLCIGYKCDECGQSFALEPLYLTHKVKDHNVLDESKGKLTCKVCEKIFDNRTAYFRHASSHSEDKCLQCRICARAFTTQESLFGHLRSIHYLIPSKKQQCKFKCEICEANFIKIEALVAHKLVAHEIEEDVVKPVKKIVRKETVPRTGHWRSEEDDVKRRTCHICHRVFSRFKDVRRHMGTHTKPHLCCHCGKSFPYRYSLSAHIKTNHLVESPFICVTCSKSFSCQKSLTVHQRIHTGEKPHRCDICQKQFRQLANFNLHLKTHNKEKPYKCELCDYQCAHRVYLKRHMSTHSTEKKHECHICNKSFNQRPNLIHHLKRHANIKQHVCNICGNRYGERYYLNNHMRVHTKEKPFVCPVCNRAFTMRPNMVAHIKKTHPSYEYKPLKRSHQNSATPITVSTVSATSANISALSATPVTVAAVSANETKNQNIQPSISEPEAVAAVTNTVISEPSGPSESQIPISTKLSFSSSSAAQTFVDSASSLQPIFSQLTPIQTLLLPESGTAILSTNSKSNLPLPSYQELSQQINFGSRMVPIPFQTLKDSWHPHHQSAMPMTVAANFSARPEPSITMENEESERQNSITLSAAQLDQLRETHIQSYFPSNPTVLSSQEFEYSYPTSITSSDPAFVESYLPNTNQTGSTADLGSNSK